MTERDLSQKLEVRKIFWAMGASTRLNVKLGSLAAPKTSKGRAASDEWTDLDVLAVQYSPLANTTYAIADCKTTKARAAERVFWVRGVADLFGATTVYMARESDLAPNARQLALRLNVAALDPADRVRLLEHSGTAALPIAGDFFAADRQVRIESILSGAPVALEKLDRYRRAFYWVFPRYRNLTQLPAYLEEASRLFNVADRWAHLVLLDLAWLYLVTVCHTIDQITRLQLAALATSLRQTVVGGEQEMREKQVLAEKLRLVMNSVAADSRESIPDVPLLPAYFEDLVDLVSRAAARRFVLTDSLRAIEFTATETVAAGGASWKQAFPQADVHAAKLASDVVRFLVRAARLNPAFVTRFDDAIEGRGLLPRTTSEDAQRPVERDPDPGPKDRGKAARTAPERPKSKTDSFRLFGDTSQD